MRGLATMFLLLLSIAPVHAESIEIGVSREAVGITSSFNGARIAVFGAVDGGSMRAVERGTYDVVVTLTGPLGDVTVRQKERRLGIWVNGDAETFGQVPSYYAVASTRALDDIEGADSERVAPGRLPIGYRDVVVPTERQRAFAKSLVRLRRNEALFDVDPQAVSFLSSRLFRASFALPANVPVGPLAVEAYLFRDGLLIARASSGLLVEKLGFEQATYDLAHNNGLLYGLLAVLVAIVTGWFASVTFGRD